MTNDDIKRVVNLFLSYTDRGVMDDYELNKFVGYYWMVTGNLNREGMTKEDKINEQT